MNDPITSQPKMKPSALQCLTLLRNQENVTTQQFGLTVGFRFSARILELRQLGFHITEKRLPHPTRGSLYTLLAEPEPSSLAGVTGNRGKAQAGSVTVTQRSVAVDKPCPPVQTSARPVRASHGARERVTGPVDGRLFDVDEYRPSASAVREQAA